MAKQIHTNYDFLKTSEIQNAIVQVLASAPSSPNEGQIYYNSTDETMYIRQSGAWLDLGQQGISDGDYGDITVGGGGTTLTIDDDAVTFAKMQNITSPSILGRTSIGSPGIVEELSSADVTDFLSEFTSTLKGVVPASGGGTTNFLRADGTWTTPAGGFSSFEVGGDSGFDQTANSGDLLDIVGGSGISTTVSKASTTISLTIDLDTTGDWTGTFDGEEGTYYLDYNNFTNTPSIPTSLPDLSDVVSATNTNGFVLVANGTTGYVGRALTEADISDLGTYLENIVEDTTPQLGGALDINGNRIYADNENLDIEIDNVSGDSINIGNQDGAQVNVNFLNGGTPSVQIGSPYSGNDGSINMGAETINLQADSSGTTSTIALYPQGGSSANRIILQPFGTGALVDINPATGGHTQIRVNSTEVAHFNSSGLQLGAANARVTTILDEDTMSSDSATALATQQSIKAYVDNAVAGGMTIIGSYNASTNTPDLDTSPSGISEGDTYFVTVAGTFFSEDVSVGDTLIAKQDNPTVLGDWIRVEKNIPDILNASLTDAGIVELATVAETNAGTDATRAVTPDGLDGWTGSAQITTLGTIGTGTWQGSVIAEAYLPDASTTAEGVVELATAAEVDAGTDTNRVITPDALANSEYGTPIQRYTEQIGDTSTTSFTINHGIGRQFVTVQVFETSAPHAQVICDIELDDANNCGVNFNTAPGTNEYTVVVVG